MAELLLTAIPVIYALTVPEVVELYKLKVIEPAVASAAGLTEGGARRFFAFCCARTSSMVVMTELVVKANKK